MNKKLITLSAFILIIMAFVVSVLIFNNSKIDNSNSMNSISNNISQSNDKTNSQQNDTIIHENTQIVDEDKSNEKVEISKPVESESDNMENKITLEINGRKLTATLEKNNSSKEFVEKLKEGSITIDMHDYGNFEKVGDLGFSITRSDKQISVGSGDIVLYQGDKVTIYYNDNSWNFTKLGHIDNISDSELEDLLGSGNVSVKFSL